MVRPVRIIVPLAAGAGIDTFTRALAQRLSQSWGQPVIVDNRPGAGATIGTAAAAKAPAKFNYGSTGSGTLAHLAGETFSRSTGINAVHVPFKGATPGLTALIAG
jgi:tripartite-type tricarboxylate transporter receptor subunit TctC